MTDISFSRCNFVTAEINHDLHEMIKANYLKRYNIWGTKLHRSCSENKNLLGEAGVQGLDEGLRNRRTSSNGDDDLVKQIFSINEGGIIKPVDKWVFFHRKDLFNENSQEKNINVLTFVGPKEKDLSKEQNKIRKAEVSVRREALLKSITEQSKNTFTNKIFDLFIPTNEKSNVSNDLFFIIDVGDELIKNILKNTAVPQELGSVNVHVIHAAETLADSARAKSPPDAVKWGKGVKPGYPQIFSWFYTKQRKNGEGMDNIMMSTFSIITKPVYPTWKMEQIWIDHDSESCMSKKTAMVNFDDKPSQSGCVDYQTYDSRFYNNKPNVMKKLGEMIARNELETSPAIASRLVQQKRSGDYLQILLAKTFPRDAANSDSHYILHNGPPGWQTTGVNSRTLSNGRQLTKEWYKKRTFFVTIDWPAFCYAAYHQVNAVLISRSSGPKTIFTLTFN